jgi:hypothetical protein
MRRLYLALLSTLVTATSWDQLMEQSLNDRKEKLYHAKSASARAAITKDWIISASR